MSVLIDIVAFAGIIVVLVVAHELGHFLTAKMRGVEVMEFGIGFPPRIFGVKRGGTIYSINALPLGGFVKLAGEEDPEVAGSLAGKGYGTRILVLSSGALINLLLPFVFFSVAFMLPHTMVTAPVVVESVAAGSPAQADGFKAGDTILTINGTKVNNIQDVQRITQLNLGNEMNVEVKQTDGALQTISIVPRWSPPQGQGAMGIVAGYSGNPVVTSQTEPVWRAVPLAVQEVWQTLTLFKNAIVGWVAGAAAPQVTGPVGIAQLSGQVARAGFSPLLELAAFISINLGIINILPLPALDGGRIAFVFLEMIRRGKRVSARTEGLVHLAGFLLLIVLMVVVTYGDIINIVTTGSAIR